MLAGLRVRGAALSAEPLELALLGGDLAPGDRVVLEGVQKMSEGRSVEVVDPAQLEDDSALQATRARGP